MRSIPALAAALLVLALGGCVTVFPKSKAARLYAFGSDFPARTAPAAGMTPFNILRGPNGFATEAAGDAILTRNGEQVAYIADSRWVSPAAVLFEEAETRAFAADGGPAQLAPRGQLVRSSAELRLNVQTFEARYAGAVNDAPTVVVGIDAILIDLADHRLIAERMFEVKKPVAENRVGAIVGAFDAATTEALGKIAAWTDDEGRSATPPAS
jgi:cholesterol transport system auxiliary component